MLPLPTNLFSCRSPPSAVGLLHISVCPHVPIGPHLTALAPHAPSLKSTRTPDCPWSREGFPSSPHYFAQSSLPPFTTSGVSPLLLPDFSPPQTCESGLILRRNSLSMVVTLLTAKPMAVPAQAPPSRLLQSMTDLFSPALAPSHKPMESAGRAVYRNFRLLLCTFLLCTARFPQDLSWKLSYLMLITE